MNDAIFNINNIRMELSYKSFDELRLILSFYEKYNLCKINIPCKSNLKKDFLLESIKISRNEFPNIDLIPHFSILHEFKRNRINTLNSLIYFSKFVKSLDCNEVLLVSGSQKRASLDSLSSLIYLKDNNFFSNNDLSFGIAFNPYLPNSLFDDEIKRLEKKIKSGLVSSIWFQFGTDHTLLASRIKLIKDIILSSLKNNPKTSNMRLYGSILIPSKQFLVRFKYRPWKGVFCSRGFLESVDFANLIIIKLLKTYNKHKICPIIETNISTEEELNKLKILEEALN